MIFDDLHKNFVNNRSKASVVLGHQTSIDQGLVVTDDDIYVFTPDEKVRIAKQRDDLRSAFSISVDEAIRRLDAQVKDGK